MRNLAQCPLTVSDPKCKNAQTHLPLLEPYALYTNPITTKDMTFYDDLLLRTSKFVAKSVYFTMFSGVNMTL